MSQRQKHLYWLIAILGSLSSCNKKYLVQVSDLLPQSLRQRPGSSEAKRRRPVHHNRLMSLGDKVGLFGPDT